MKRICHALLDRLLRYLLVASGGFLGLGCLLYAILLATNTEHARAHFWSHYFSLAGLPIGCAITLFLMSTASLLTRAKLYGRRRAIDFRDVAEAWFVHRLHRREGHPSWSRDQFYTQLRAARRTRRITNHRTFMGHKRTWPKDPPPAA